MTRVIEIEAAFPTGSTRGKRCCILDGTSGVTAEGVLNGSVQSLTSSSISTATAGKLFVYSTSITALENANTFKMYCAQGILLAGPVFFMKPSVVQNVTDV